MGPPSCTMGALSPHTSGTGSWEGVPYVHAHHRLGQVSALWRRFPKTGLYQFSFSSQVWDRILLLFGILSTILVKDRDGEGQGSLACCLSWGCKESDTTERLNWTELMDENFPNLKKKHFKNTVSIIFSRLVVTLSQKNILKAGG